MALTETLQNDLLLRVARGEEVDRPPVWLMRQAGRFLTEYREVRKQAGSFRAMIAHPELAAEVTLQPVDLIGVDAAIIFSDILVLPEAIGLTYDMIPGKGPLFPKVIASPKDLALLHDIEEESNLDHTYAAIRMVKRELAGRVPLIGFAGAPWTIFCYMTEGSGSKTFSKAKAFLYREPEFAHQLLQKITDATVHYLHGQIAAGVNLIQVFDSWAGILNGPMFREFALPYISQICDAIQKVPVTVFAKGAFFALPEMDQLDCQVIGLDWHVNPAEVSPLFSDKSLQGNMDPCLLYADRATVRTETIKMLKSYPAHRHIANLGHGIYPDLPRENVQEFVNTVKGFTYE
ncbi:MAG: uroporphyrinogen decarboxylase [Bacteroidota bacterium]